MRVVLRTYRSVVLSLLGFSACAQAGNIAWLNPLGGNFSSPINWLGSIAPGASDIASFDLGGGSLYTTTLTGSVTNSQLAIAADAVTFNLAGSNYTLSSKQYEPGTFSAQIGSALGGTLNVTNSSNSTATLSTQYASIASLATDTGAASVSGPHTVWSSAIQLSVGDAGNGSLSISKGASVSDLMGAIGYQAGAVGSAVIDGAGSNWNNGDYLYVGGYGSGSLTIQNGAKSTNGVTYVGQYGPGTATVTGAGSNLTTQYLDVAYATTGSLTINNGATVVDSDGYISCSVNSPGTVTIAGVNTTWTNTDTLYAGLGSGTVINIDSGATLSVSKTFGMANQAGNQIDLAGGTLNVGTLNTVANPSLFLGNGVTTGWTSGTLNITLSNLNIASDGPLSSSLTLGAGKKLEVTGTGFALSIASGSSMNVAGGSVYANTINNSGTLSLPLGSTVEAVNPLVNTGVIDVSGGTLQLDAGTASGSVRTQILSAYDDGNWDGNTGITSSAAENDPHHDTALAYITTGNTTKVMFTWYGDTNGDGVVNALDAAAIKANGTTWQTGDFNYDGQVNSDDWSLFLLGSLYGSNVAPNLVPEPVSLLAALPLLMVGRRRK